MAWRCPHCRDSLEHPPIGPFGRPVFNGDSLITFIGEIAYHSGHCELMGLQGRNPKKTWITGFPRPKDIERLYGAI